MNKHAFLKRLIVVSLSICVIILIASSTLNCICGGYIKDNKLTFTVPNSLLIVHIKFETGSKENPVAYKIINPKNKVISEGTAKGVIDYLGHGDKGKWTILFDKNQSKKMRHILWSGNWTFYDSADKNFSSYTQSQA